MTTDPGVSGIGAITTDPGVSGARAMTTDPGVSELVCKQKSPFVKGNFKIIE